MSLGHHGSAIILDECPLASICLAGQTGADAVPAGGPLKIVLSAYQTSGTDCTSPTAAYAFLSSPARLTTLRSARYTHHPKGIVRLKLRRSFDYNDAVWCLGNSPMLFTCPCYSA